MPTTGNVFTKLLTLACTTLLIRQVSSSPPSSYISTSSLSHWLHSWSLKTASPFLSALGFIANKQQFPAQVNLGQKGNSEENQVAHTVDKKLENQARRQGNSKQLGRKTQPHQCALPKEVSITRMNSFQPRFWFLMFILSRFTTQNHGTGNLTDLAGAICLTFYVL